MLAAALLALAAPLPVPTCAEAKRLRSIEAPADASPTMHAFQNGEPRPLTLYWIDPAGKRVAIDTIPPGGFKSVTTYVGHAFLLTDDTGACRAALRVENGRAGSYVGTSRYRPVALRAWHVYADQALDPHTVSTRTALATIDRMLAEAERVLPPATLDRVQTTPIYLMEHAGPGGMFHHDPAWLIAHRRTLELLRAVEISDAETFAQDARPQPALLLHELAHALYWELPETTRAAVEACYRAAMAAGLYRAVERVDGQIVPAYAATNAAEYFAELSEAYFSRNDFYPFDRAELTRHDPAGSAMVAQVWSGERPTE